MFEPGDYVKVTNKDENPIEFWWNSKRWVVLPNHSKDIPVEAVINKSGDPRSGTEKKILRFGEDKHYIATRDEEITRLRNLYGKQDGHPREVPEPYPHFEVYDSEGERVFTVLEDPEGEHSNLSVLTEAEERSREDRISYLESQLRMLQSQMATSQSEIPSVDEPDAPVPRTSTLKKPQFEYPIKEPS